MFGFFWPEYQCVTNGQVLITEEEFSDPSVIDYLEGQDPNLEPEPA